ncbi:MAG: ABC transporter permease [Rhodocyclaceae bacterium]|nr:ABC transporter permease [Rhodocyclaceae bacterium]
MWRPTPTSLMQDVKLAMRNMLRHRRRSLLALATVGSGVIAFLLAGGFINWVLVSMREATIHSQLGHIQITRPGYFSEGLGDPYSHLLPPRAMHADRIGRLGNVKTVAPRLAFSGLLSKEDATVSFLGEGIDPALEAPITDEINIVEGKDLTESPPESLLLGQGLAASIDAHVGDTLVLLATTQHGRINAVEARVAGIFVTVAKAYDDSVLRAPIVLARKLMDVEGATSWAILLAETDQTEKTVERLRQEMDSADFEVIPWTDLADFYNKTVELFSKQVGIVRLLIALIVILSISNTMTMAVMERTNEIGTSMALGVRRSSILRLFLLEGLAVGVVGGVGGTAIGLLLGELISAVGIPMPPPPGMTTGYLGEIQISAALSIDALTLAIVTTLAASIFPAWKASRMNVVDALRHQR